MGMVPNGLLPNASAGVTRRLDLERWAVAESRTAELIALIQPNAHSEGRRQAVYSYVQRLIMNCLSCQVVTFGSVPLKTYLPDGDIDVTAFSNSEELKDSWANLVRDALEHEEKSGNAEFRVKEVQCIQAEKVPFRDRHPSSRNYRGSSSGDKGDHSDKGSWINSKQRNPGCSYGRSQSERSGMRSNRQTADESQSDRQRRSYRNDSYRHEAGAQYFVQGQSFGSTNSIRRLGNMTHGVYSSPSTASNGVGALSGSSTPPYFMLHSCGSSSEPLEFVSLGPVPTADGGDIPRPTRQVMANGLRVQRHAAFREALLIRHLINRPHLNLTGS